MPAYFNISLEFDRKRISPQFVHDLHGALRKAGLTFKCGERGFENISEKEMIAWNQSKLEENFKLGFTEHYANDYRQTVYEYGNFSEVRGFWLNGYPEEEECTYEIIIPEADLIVWGEDYHDALCYKKRELGELIAAAKVLWTELPLMTIQTGTEREDETVSISQYREGILPAMHPFAVVPEELGGVFDDACGHSGLHSNLHDRMHIQKIERGGILVIDFTAETENTYIQDMEFWRQKEKQEKS